MNITSPLKFVRYVIAKAYYLEDEIVWSAMSIVLVPVG